MSKEIECSTSKEPTADTPLINNMKKQSTMDRFDCQDGSLDNQGNYKYKKWCGVRRSTCLLLLFIIFYTAFILCGAGVMMALEEDNLFEKKKEAVEFKKEFVKRNNINETELEQFISDVYSYDSYGVSMLDEDLNKTEWGLGESVLMCVLTVTTIGYGHLTPITDLGKFFIILYAVVGLPLTVVLLTACVQKLEGPLLKLIYNLKYASTCCESRLSNSWIKFIHLVSLIVIFWICIITIPSIIFWYIEYPEWSHLDSFYFVFVSVTTIGYGDFVPGDHPEDNETLQNFYKVCVSVFLVLSMIWMGLTGIAFYDIPSLNLGDYLSHDRDIYISNTQLCGSDIEKLDETEEE